MKLGIIGSGAIVKEFLPKLIKMEGIDILGILGTARSADRVKEMCAANKIDCAAADFDELCSTGIDTVYIAVPNSLHVDYCVKALEKGLNVIVEKPMAGSYKEAVYLQNLAKKKECFLFEAITTLYLGNYKKIIEWLPRIGDIKLVQSQYSQYSSRYDAFREGTVLPAFDPDKAGGALMDLNLYNLHFIMGIFGEPEDVIYFANIDRGIDTSGMLIMKYPSFLASCVAAKDSKGWQGSVIQGIDGCIKCNYPANFVGMVSIELNDGTKEEYDDKGYTERMIPEFTAFMDAISRHDLEFCYDRLDQSVRVSRVQDTARKGAGIHFAADNRTDDNLGKS